MRWVDGLRRDREVVDRLLAALESVTGTGAAEALSGPLVSTAVNVLGPLVERCHHAKEAAVIDRLPPADGLERLRADHRAGRARLAAVRRATASPAGMAAAVRLLAEYVRAERDHLARAADLLLSEAAIAAVDGAAVARAFADIEQREHGKGGHESLLETATALETSCRRVGRRPDAERRGSAADVMRRNVGAVSPTASLAHALATMEALDVREVPVVDGGRLVGILSRRDLEPYRGHFEWTSVRAAMTREPVVVAPETPVREVARLLLHHGVNAIPVVAGDTVVGMVGRAELLRLLAGDG